MAFAVYHMTPASLSTPSGTWDISITWRSGATGFKFRFIDFIQGSQQSRLPVARLLSIGGKNRTLGCLSGGGRI